MADYSGADATVQATNDSSIVSKASTAAAGYFEDAFVGHVAVRGPKGRLIRRSPLVHRCYYVRHLGVFQMQEMFLRSCISSGDAYNVVVLGAGFDTGALRRGWPQGLRGYFEVDFPAVLSRKEALLRQAQVVRPDWLYSCGADLRNTAEVEASLKGAGVDFQVPTLLIAEVVLAYMEYKEGNALIEWVGKAFPNCLFGIYEQIGPHDPFGRFMRRHFIQRQCPLRALLSAPDLEAQRARFRSFHRVDAANMVSILNAAPKDELMRAFQLEAFDEFEEFHLKCVHYFCLAAMSGSCTRAKQQWEDSGPNPSFTKSVFVSSSDVGIPRFGHAASYSNGHLVICGGQGTFNSTASDAPHGRQQSIMHLKVGQPLDGFVRSEKMFQEVGEHPAAMYCTSTVVDSQIFFFGGRLAPQRPSSALSICRIAENGPVVKQVPQSNPWPTARWRHTATKINIGGPGVLILGGVGETVFTLEEAWFLDTESLTWQHFSVEAALDGSFPAPRHSHAAALGSGGVLVCGGLDADEQILGDAWTLHAVFDGCFKLAWRRALSPLPQPRYGHSLHEHLGHFIVVGGIEAKYGPAPVCAYGKPLDIQCEAMKDGEPEIFMWHNLASVVMEGSGYLLIIGGGGNCFSFGTHLNQSARLVNLNEVIKAAELAQKDCLCTQCFGACWPRSQA